MLLVSKATHLRQQANLYRRIANIPTEGGRRKDRVLVIIANKLERHADALEQGDRQTRPTTRSISPATCRARNSTALTVYGFDPWCPTARYSRETGGTPCV